MECSYKPSSIIFFTLGVGRIPFLGQLCLLLGETTSSNRMFLRTIIYKFFNFGVGRMPFLGQLCLLLGETTSSNGMFLQTIIYNFFNFGGG